mmetsp:Transcript_122092/g.237394  ORF Transcript_122092/g.237394 Transcript_122092/m.237394 type:complete len:217 (+) Transcript_122092:108-758(+)
MFEALSEHREYMTRCMMDSYDFVPKDVHAALASIRIQLTVQNIAVSAVLAYKEQYQQILATEVHPDPAGHAKFRCFSKAGIRGAAVNNFDVGSTSWSSWPCKTSLFQQSRHMRSNCKKFFGVDSAPRSDWPCKTSLFQQSWHTRSSCQKIGRWKYMTCCMVDSCVFVPKDAHAAVASIQIQLTIQRTSMFQQSWHPRSWKYMTSCMMDFCDLCQRV